jgi:RNA polymerase sigma-70 factor, ECF subfamily
MTAESNEAFEEGPTEISDAVLVSTAKSGDADAFVELSKRHYRRVFYETYRITRNQQDAEDALQDSLLNAFCHLKHFQERANFSTWLTRIAINSALMILRKKRNCFEFSLDGSDDPSGKCQRWETQSLGEDPESNYVRREREALLREAILRLPRGCREVVELWQAREHSAREIAQALGISVPAVKTRLSRARSTLRAELLPSDWKAPQIKCSNHSQRSSLFEDCGHKNIAGWLSSVDLMDGTRQR